MLEVVLGLVFIGGTLAASRLVEALDLLRFPLCWLGVLLALDGAARLRHGASPLRRPTDWLACAAASLLFWDLFELLDLRLQNWWYTGVSPSPVFAAAFAAISFATVLPAVRLGLSVLSPRDEPALQGAQRKRPLLLAGLGLLALSLSLLLPRVAFPLAWLFLWPLAEAALCLLPRGESLPGPLEAWGARDGRLARRLLLLALPLGLVWESLNWQCPRGWVYTVPGFESLKLFEMPLPGYLGYLPFLLEASAVLALLERLRPRLRGRRGALALCAVLALHLGADRLAQERTVLSRTPRLADLVTVPPETLALLVAQGVETPRDFLARAPVGLSPRIAQRLREVSEIAEATRMGVPRAERLVDAGVAGNAGLVAADPARVAALLGDEPALARLWIDAAKRAVLR